MQFPELNTKDRIIITGSCLFLFILAAGFELLDQRNGLRLFLTFTTGILIAVWAGHETLGSFPPLSIRLAYILLGCGLMFYSFFMTMFLRIGAQ